MRFPGVSRFGDIAVLCTTVTWFAWLCKIPTVPLDRVRVNHPVASSILQRLSGTAGGFLQIVTPVVYYVKLFLLGSTPRSVYGIKCGVRSLAWGTTFPGITLLLVIALVYSIIVPIINADVHACGVAPALLLLREPEPVMQELYKELRRAATGCANPHSFSHLICAVWFPAFGLIRRHHLVRLGLSWCTSLSGAVMRLAPYHDKLRLAYAAALLAPVPRAHISGPHPRLCTDMTHTALIGRLLDRALVMCPVPFGTLHDPLHLPDADAVHHRLHLHPHLCPAY
ncbi:hypothetical protein B0H17DRAFT_1217952 [Mycena rosella]|uniref:CSC1/OSCA1-like 7TM region domain-containing protein n=1 Tax=Mycena rosella TaxID=1033263 RepID=A0AAD7BT73_MYCRO|nr:hypothetical protein B0H17DRAFT_1217952 [Mycena rosella]